MTLSQHPLLFFSLIRLSIKYIRKAMNLVIRFLRRRKMTIAVDSTGFSSARIRAAPGTTSASNDMGADGTAMLESFFQDLRRVEIRKNGQERSSGRIISGCSLFKRKS
jgi:hypothetical protein